MKLKLANLVARCAAVIVLSIAERAGAVGSFADLAIYKSDSTNSVQVGQQLQFFLTLSNGGPSLVTGAVTVDDNLPAGFQYIGSAGNGFYANGAWTVVPGASGNINSLTITAQATTTGLYTNTATITTLPAGIVDPNPANNTSSAVVNVTSAQAQQYFIAGDFINDWSSPQGSQMYGGPTIYTNVVTGGTPGNYEVLKVTDGTWNNAWPVGFANNLQIDFDAGGTNTIYFMPGTFTDGWYPTANRVGYNNPGNVWEVSGDFTSPIWGDDASAQMTADGNGVLSVSYLIPIAGTYSFKFKTVGTWNGAIGTDFGMIAANASITTISANETLLFKLDLPNGRYQILPTVTNQVVFAVDMSSQVRIGYFHPGSSVFVSGDFNDWAGTGAGALALTNYPPYNGGSNTNIYYGTYTFIGLPNSAGSDYLFTDNDPGQPASDNGYEQVNNRSFNLLAVNGILLLPVVYFGNYDVADYLPDDTAVLFSVDMNNAVGTDEHSFNPAFDSVYINGEFADYNGQFGSWYPWSGSVNPASAPAGYEMVESNLSTIYTNTLIIPAGTPVGFEYKYGMDPASANGGPLDDEAAFKVNHFRVVRSTALKPYPMPTDTFGNQHDEPLFSATSTGGANLNVGNPVSGKVPVSWLGRPGAHLQVNTNLSSGTWNDIFETDGTNWIFGYSSTDGFVSQTNWPSISKAFFRLVKP